MHISEGVLSLKWCAAGYTAAAPLAGYALYKTRQEDIPKIAVMSAAFFASSLVHFNVGITSVHLTLIGLTGIVLGVHSVLAILSGLLFQAVMFQHGGLSTLGINTVTMGGTSLAVYGVFRLLRSPLKNRPVLLSLTGGILSGAGVISAALAVAGIIVLAEHEFAGISAVFTLGNGIVALIESAAGTLIIRQLLRVKPELITGESRVGH